MRAPAIGERWEVRRLLAILTAFAVAAAMVALYGGTARADHVSEMSSDTEATSTSSEATTSTSVADTSTSSEATTSTTSTTSTTVADASTPSLPGISDDVLPTVVTTAPEVDDEDELPFTGLDADVMIGLSILFLGLGAVLLTLTRRLEEN